MSKYTTEVRYICETDSGLDESVGFNSVDAVISKSWDKIFTSKVPFFDEDYRKVLCCKILKHYYLREICCETVGIWKLWVNTKLEEIMPYYNQLYESAKLKFNPLHDVDLTRKRNRYENEKSTGNRSGNINIDVNKTQTTSSDKNSNANGEEKNLFSDTPQGGLYGVDNQTYLTDARKINTTKSENENVSSNATEKTGGSSKDSEQSSGNVDTTEDYIETIVGKQNSENYSSLIMKYRETFLNIDMLVIKEFDELFFGLW